MMFSFIAKHRGIWPVALICEALGVSRSGFYAWATRKPSDRAKRDEMLTAEVRKSFLDSDRTYGARRVWRDVLAAGLDCGLHAIERLMQANALKARPRRRRLPSDTGVRPATELASVKPAAAHAKSDGVSDGGGTCIAHSCTPPGSTGDLARWCALDRDRRCRAKSRTNRPPPRGGGVPRFTPAACCLLPAAHVTHP